ncbi:MAG: DNA polymerase III subunit delta [Bacteroidota bacterium]
MKDYLSIKKEISEKVFHPVYFLQGDETFFIDDLAKTIERDALEESQKGFNQLVVYGRDSSLPEVVSAAKRYPMMGERSVVIVKEAQELKDWKREDAQQVLISYLDNPLPSTILVVAYKHKTFDKRSKLGKALEKNSTFLNAKKLYDNQVPDWILSYCRSKNIAIDSAAVRLLSESIGNNLQRLANEIEKLCLNISGSQTITSDLVHTYVGISKEYNIFELQKALSYRDQLKAQKIVRYFSANPSNNPLVLTISSLFSYFSKILSIHQIGLNDERSVAAGIGVNPYFVKEYIQAAHNYPFQKVVQNIEHIHTADLQSKGINFATMKDEAILGELIFKLMN